jgi:uncharacterized membrane protein
MYFMRGAAGDAGGFGAFFYWNAFLLSLAAVVTAVALYRMAGARALYFALAPTLLIYGFVNWDLLAVALATGATLAFVRRRDVLAGALLGLGAAAKLYPAFLIVPFAAERFRKHKPDSGVHLVWAAVGAWLAVNLPFMVAAPHGWKFFYTNNAHRPADFDSLWFISCDHFHTSVCDHTGTLNVLSLAAFVGLSAVLWAMKARRDPDAPWWVMGFPIIVAFLLTSKVYSPQYGLWLLPWFALVLPNLRLFLAFEAADLAVFVTRFAFFGSSQATGGWTHAITLGMFQIALLVRAAVLVACAVAFVVHKERVRASLPEPVAVAA